MEADLNLFLTEPRKSPNPAGKAIKRSSIMRQPQPITGFSEPGTGLLGDVEPGAGSSRQGCEQEGGVNMQSGGSAGSSGPLSRYSF